MECKYSNPSQKLNRGLQFEFLLNHLFSNLMAWQDAVFVHCNA